MDWESIDISALGDGVPEELQMLEAMYPDDFVYDIPTQTIRIALSPTSTDNSKTNVYVTLHLTLPSDYPVDSAPEYTIQTSRGMSETSVKQLYQEMKDTANNYLGDVCVFQIIEAVRVFLDNMQSDDICEICLESCSDKDTKFVTDCLHVFHKWCFSRWVWHYDKKMARKPDNVKRVEAAQARIDTARKQTERYSSSHAKLSDAIRNDQRRLQEVETRLHDLNETLWFNPANARARVDVCEQEIRNEYRQTRIEREATETRIKENLRKQTVVESKLQSSQSNLRAVLEVEQPNLEPRKPDPVCPVCRAVCSRALCDACIDDDVTNMELYSDSNSSTSSDRWDDVTVRYIAKVRKQCRETMLRQAEIGGLIDDFEAGV